MREQQLDKSMSPTTLQCTTSWESGPGVVGTPAPWTPDEQCRLSCHRRVAVSYKRNKVSLDTRLVSPVVHVTPKGASTRRPVFDALTESAPVGSAVLRAQLHLGSQYNLKEVKVSTCESMERAQCTRNSKRAEDMFEGRFATRSVPHTACAARVDVPRFLRSFQTEMFVGDFDETSACCYESTFSIVRLHLRRTTCWKKDRSPVRILPDLVLLPWACQFFRGRIIPRDVLRETAFLPWPMPHLEELV